MQYSFAKGEEMIITLQRYLHSIQVPSELIEVNFKLRCCIYYPKFNCTEFSCKPAKFRHQNIAELNESKDLHSIVLYLLLLCFVCVRYTLPDWKQVSYCHSLSCHFFIHKLGNDRLWHYTIRGTRLELAWTWSAELHVTSAILGVACLLGVVGARSWRDWSFLQVLIVK